METHAIDLPSLMINGVKPINEISGVFQGILKPWRCDLHVDILYRNCCKRKITGQAIEDICIIKEPIP